MPRRLLLLLLVLFALRTAAILYAYDYRPMVTSNDEVYWAEPAWALLHGQGYTLPCCKGMLFGDFYPQHPPIFVFVLAGTFKLFGLAPATIRLPGIFAHLAGIVLMLAIFWRLRRLRVLDLWGFLIAAILILCDFSTLYVARWGRPDPFTTTLALAAFYTLIAGRMKPNALRPRAGVAAILIGLSLSTHTIAVFYFGLFVLALWLLRRRLGGSNTFACMLMPLAVFAIFWLGVFGDRSFEALWRHRELAAIMGGAGKPATSSINYLQAAISDPSAQTAFLQAGGTTAILILATFAFFCLRILTTRPVRRGAWLVLAAALAGQAFMIWKMTSLGITRCYIYFPFTVFVLAILLTHWRPGLRRIALIGVLGWAASEIGQTVYILYGTSRNLTMRAPDRHHALMDRLAQYSRVGVPPVLWYQARARGLNFRLIDLSISKQREEWQNNPHPFAEFDAVVLRANSPLRQHPDLAAITPEEIPEPMARYGLLLYVLRPLK